MNHVDKDFKGLYNYLSFFGVWIMHIYLPEIKLKDGEAVDFRFAEELSDCFDDFSEDGNLNLMISVSCSGDKVMIRGSLEASVESVCSRCLEAFTHNFKTDFAEAFTAVANASADDSPDMLADEVANMLTVSGDYLYLDEYIRQLVILAQDYSPLCKAGCKGICAGCGIDLNKSFCRCDPDDSQIDIRLLKLKELKSGRQV